MDDIFKFILLNENVGILTQVSLKFVSEDPVMGQCNDTYICHSASMC